MRTYTTLGLNLESTCFPSCITRKIFLRTRHCKNYKNFCCKIVLFWCKMVCTNNIKRHFYYRFAGEIPKASSEKQYSGCFQPLAVVESGSRFLFLTPPFVLNFWCSVKQSQVNNKQWLMSYHSSCNVKRLKFHVNQEFLQWSERQRR